MGLFDVAVLMLVLGASATATAYLWRLYLSDEAPRSWILWTLAAAATSKLVIGGWFAALVIYRIAIEIDLPTWTRPISYVAVCILLLTSCVYAVQIERRRRRAARTRSLKEALHDADARKDPEPG